MKVALIQAYLFWQDREKNLDHLAQLIHAAAGTADLFILPEMFSTGFTMSPETQAEPSGGKSLMWMKKLSVEKNAVICGSVAVEDNGSYYNRLYWVEPGGRVSHYDKRHLFRMGNEHQHYTPGNKKIVEHAGGMNVCPLVCYDLRFPVWSRNRLTGSNPGDADYEYDLLVYVANWPAVRNYAWRQLLIARAIENQCFVAGVNRVGKDGNNTDHSGSSLVIGPQGEILAETQPELEQVLFFDLDPASLLAFRSRFPAGLDADEFTLNT